MTPSIPVEVRELAAALAQAIASLPLPARVEGLNHARTVLHEQASPFAAEPVDLVLWVLEERVESNDWNPNTVARPEMASLVHSITRFGYTLPIAGSWLGVAPARVGINDGFHRHLVPRLSPEIRSRLHGYLPVTILATKSDAERMLATQLHNQARGEHDVQREVAMLQRLETAGLDDEALGVGMVKSDEELIRMRQVGGVAQHLASPTYGKAWTLAAPEK